MEASSEDRQSNSEVPIIAGEAGMSLQDYVRSAMGKTGLNSLMNKEGVSSKAVRAMHEVGIRTASDVMGNFDVQGVEPAEFLKIMDWYHEQEQSATQQYFLRVNASLLPSDEYVKRRMQDISANAVMLLPGISLPTVQQLHKANIKTIADYVPSTALDIPEEEKVMLDCFYRSLESHFQKEQRTQDILPVGQAIVWFYKNYKAESNQIIGDV